MIRILAIAAVALLVHPAAPFDAKKTVPQLLGYNADTRMLIINGDDFGMSHATNMAIFDALENGVLTSATIMMPTAWVKEAADWIAQHPDADIGVHLTHTSEWSGYRWAPILGRDAVPGLVDSSGYMWGECEEVWSHATPKEAARESRAQIEYARRLGIDVTHIDSHMGTMQLHPKFAEKYLQLSVEYNLPQRQASAKRYAEYGVPGLKQKERQAKVLGPDHLIYDASLPDDLQARHRAYNDILRNLKPGLTELYLHPAIDGPVMQTITGTHEQRDADYRWLIDPETKKLIEKLDIKLIGYRELREFMQQAE